MRVTEKGQVTIPKHIRDKAGIRPGTEVDFRLEDGRIQIVKRRRTKRGESAGQALVRELQAAARCAVALPLSTDEVMEMTRGPFDDVDPG
jgi:AbrB family looped-hinge helix DNA binding protein